MDHHPLNACNAVEVTQLTQYVFQSMDKATLDHLLQSVLPRVCQALVDEVKGRRNGQGKGVISMCVMDFGSGGWHGV